MKVDDPFRRSGSPLVGYEDIDPDKFFKESALASFGDPHDHVLVHHFDLLCC